MTKFPTLYARDSKGKILQWKIEVLETGLQVDIKKSYGEFNGGQALRWQRNIQGKNIGKANETSPLEQAIFQVESEIKTKKDKGYMSIEDIGIYEENGIINLFDYLNTNLPKFRQDAKGGVKPMKAQQYYRSAKNWLAPDNTIWEDRKYYYLKNPYVEKEPKSIITKFPAIAQPKINGVRCTLEMIENKAEMKSKEGLSYNIPHILDYMNLNSDLFNYNGIDLILDGELYIHGEPLSEISSAVKKVSLITQRLEFRLFDLAIPDKTQIERWNIIKELKAIFESNLHCPINVIRSFVVRNDKEAQTITDKFIEQGYEGSIFRSMDAEYKFGSRPVTMTKLKRCISAEFKIIGITPQEKDPTKGNFVCITKGGLNFDVDPKGCEDYKREVLDNKQNYIGKNLTLTFYEWTEDKKPFHILEAVVRDYE